jgi:Rrf2 family iron-sulfur cluster assembly transcriptional regulator
MILGAKARYAVMAMVDLANHSGEKPVRLAEIAQRQEIPPAYLEQIFSRLRQRGLIQSVKGPGGGYMLVCDVRKIPIYDIVAAAEEEMKMTQCEMQSKTGCMAGKEQCVTHDLWEGLGDHIYNYFNAISLEDVCQKRLRREKRKFPIEKI